MKRKGGFVLLCCILLTVFAGCKRSDSPDKSAKQPQSSSELIRIHWLGKKRISAETNALGLMKLWNLPESARLESQTLDKLALALAHQLPITNNISQITNYGSFLGGASALLRPLLDKILQEECYFEMRQPSNQPCAANLAIRLDETSAGLWQTNLGAAMQILTGVHPESKPNTQGWHMKLDDLRPLISFGRPPNSLSDRQPGSIELTRSGEWTLIAFSQNTTATTALKSEVPLPFLEQIRHPIKASSPQTASHVSGTNFWLEAEIDLAALAPIFGLNFSLPPNFPRIAVNVIGDRENVRTRGHLDFAKSLPYREEAWNIPTNFMSQPLTSFTAIRGIAPWLESLKIWSDLKIGSAPNQFYFWALQGPMQTYFAAPHPKANDLVSNVTALVLEKGAAFFTTNGISKFEKSTTFNGLKWSGLPVISPFVESLDTKGGNYVLGGLLPFETTNTPPSIELLAQFLGQTNLVYYDWELGGWRSEGWHYLSQFFRFASFREQMRAESAALTWLKAVSAELGNCGTTVTLTAPNQLSFVRISRLGLTAFELHLLADWLEAPEFPHGLHSFLPAQAPMPPAQNQKLPAKP